jgi:hypothetical protein
MATADHTERRAPAGGRDSHGAHAHHGHDAHGHDAHGAHGHGHGHGHGADDVAGDKKAAFVGLVGGMAVIGALVYGMVLWTNAQFAGHAAGGERPAAAAAQH